MERNEQENVALFYKYEKLVDKVWFDRFRCFREEKEDLLQCGRLGLWKACITYDANKEIKFMTFAFTCISNEMGMYIRKEAKHWQNTSRYIVEMSDGTQWNVLELIDNGQYSQMLADADLKIMSTKVKYKDDIARIYEGQTMSEIARDKGVTREAIRSRILKARTKIYDKCEDRSI